MDAFPEFAPQENATSIESSGGTGRVVVIAGGLLLVSCGLCVWSLVARWISTATPSVGLTGYHGTATGVDLLHANHTALEAMGVGRFTMGDVAAWVVVVVAAITGVWGLRCILDRGVSVDRQAIIACSVAVVLVGAALALATPSNFPRACGPDLVCTNGDPLEIASRGVGQWIAGAAGGVALVALMLLAEPRWRRRWPSTEDGPLGSGPGTSRAPLSWRHRLRVQAILAMLLVVAAGIAVGLSSSSGTINLQATELSTCLAARDFAATMAPNPYRHAELMDRIDHSASLISASPIGGGALDAVSFFRRHHTDTFLFDLVGPLEDCQSVVPANLRKDTMQVADTPGAGGWGVLFFGDDSLYQRINTCGDYVAWLLGDGIEPYPAPGPVATSLKRRVLAAASALKRSRYPAILSSQYKQACLALHLPSS